MFNFIILEAHELNSSLAYIVSSLSIYIFILNEWSFYIARLG